MSLTSHSSTFLLPNLPTDDGPVPTYALVILNQSLPRFTPLLWKHAQIHICADGGANRVFDELPGMFPHEELSLIRKRYKPFAIKGDMDSIRTDVLDYYKGLGTKIIDESQDQDTTDLHKCISYIRDLLSPEHPNLCILVTGALGGRWNLLHKFKASTKAISSLSISSDGKILATATSQLKIFNCLDDKKLQKFSGHPGAVTCMVFSEDGRHILSSAVGDRHVAVWKLDGSKKKSACCLLAMDHPAVFLDSYNIKSGAENDAGFGVLAISEIGVFYFWHGKSFEELHNRQPTKICTSLDEKILKKHKEAVHCIFSAKLQSIGTSGSGHMFVAYGLLIKPSFEKVMVQPGEDIKLKSSLDGILLPFSQCRKSKQASNTQSQVTALDRANAEGALLPLPMNFDQVGLETGIKPSVSKDVIGKQGQDEVTICMEDQLRSLGIISSDYDLLPTSILDDEILKRISANASVQQKKMKAAVLSMEPHDAYNFLKALVAAWQSRSSLGTHVLPWICCILVNHNEFVTSQEPLTPLLDSMNKLTKSKMVALNSLLQLSGCMQLVMAQIEKGDNKKGLAMTLKGQMNDSEDDEVDEVMYGIEESQMSSDGDD